MRRFLALVLLALTLAACGQTPTSVPTTETNSEVSAQPGVTLTPTIANTPSPTPTSTASPTPGPSLEELMGTPNALSAAAKLDSASAAFESLGELYPHRAEPLLGLAGLALRQGDMGSALTYLKQAIEADPTSLDAHRQLALLQEQLGLYEDAAATYGSMLDIRPNDPDLLVARATVYARLGRADDAITDLQAAQAVDPYRQYAWVNVAAAASGGRFYDQAAQIAAAGLAVNPDIVSLHLERGLALVSINQTDEAVDEFSTAITLDPNNSSAYHWRGRVLAQIGKTDDALADLKKAGELGIREGIQGTNEGYEAMADAADLLAQSGKVDDAFAYLAQQVIHYGSQGALLMGYARIDFRRGNTESALARLAPLVRDGFVPAFYWRGVINAAAGNQEDAIKDYSAFLQVRRYGPEVETARRALSDLGVNPDTIIAPTPTPTLQTSPSDDDGGD